MYRMTQIFKKKIQIYPIKYAVNPGQIDTVLFLSLCTIGIMMIVPKSHNQLTDFFIFYCKNNVENDEKKTIIRFRCMFLGLDFFSFLFLSFD